MKLVGWTSMAALLIAGTAIAQVEEAEKAKVEVPSNVPQTHTVKDGDTLWDITQTYYGDPYRWPQVWSYNPDITNPHWIYPDATVQLRPEDGNVVETAPKGFKRVNRFSGITAPAVYQAEYGFLDSNALKDSGYIIGANEEHMMLAESDVAYVRFAEEVEPEIGRLYTVFRKIEKIERESWEKGELIRIIGAVRLEDYDEKRRLGHAVVVRALEGIERGFRIAPTERNFHWVSVVPAEVSLRATVVASLYPRKLPSTNQIVFVNVGAEQGVVLGNRFYIVRQGDEWRRSAEGKIGREIETTVPLPDEPEHYPWEVVALGRAVNVQPNTTAILLERATRAVRMGDRAELRKGE
jgi:hypothetical protein